MVNYIKELNKKLFEDVIVFSFSEVGAMGPRDMTFYTKKGESFSVDYMSGETPYSMLKEYFPALAECYWSGPMRNESATLTTIVIGGSSDDKETCVAKGWKHIYLDVGNHIAVREEYYTAIKDIFTGKDNCDITFSWVDMLNESGFYQKAEMCAKAYNEQKEKDKRIIEILEKLKDDPEYIKKMNEAGDNKEAMLSVLYEFSGIKMTWQELRQFSMRILKLTWNQKGDVQK